MDQDNYNERMCKLIWHEALQCSIKTLSWGVDFCKIKVIENGTEFHVQGFKITGIVKVQYMRGADLFRITIIPDNDTDNPVVIEDVYIDQLVDVIDNNVEYCENYEKRVSQEYRLKEKMAV